MDRDGSKRAFFPSAAVAMEFAQEFSHHVQASGIATEIRGGMDVNLLSICFKKR
jgi:hypothetical protein